MQLNCPHCEASLEIPESPDGGPVDCTACENSFLPPQIEATRPQKGASAVRLPAAESAGGRGPKDIRLSTTGLLAAALTAAFYLGVVVPLGHTFVGQIFGERGWVPYVISYLTIWCAVLLVSKFRRLSQQRRSLEFDLLPRTISARITPEACQSMLDYLTGLKELNEADPLTRRISQTLEHFQARGSVVESVDRLRLQSDRDEGIVESSYTMLRVFIWAIPILGFIGTVLGIGQSVGGFSESVSAAADLAVMKDSIGVVTSGLGVAFDTTLLALVMSIFIMFPTSSLQKAEEDYLALVDDYCQKHLVVRLQQSATEGAAGQQAGWLKEMADRLAAEVVLGVKQRLSEEE